MRHAYFITAACGLWQCRDGIRRMHSGGSNRYRCDMMLRGEMLVWAAHCAGC